MAGMERKGIDEKVHTSNDCQSPRPIEARKELLSTFRREGVTHFSSLRLPIQTTNQSTPFEDIKMEWFTVYLDQPGFTKLFEGLLK
jgi:hypothetical protein